MNTLAIVIRVLCVLSAIMLGLAVYAGVDARRKVKANPAGGENEGDRAVYARLPILVPTMLACLAVNFYFASVWLYVITGIGWALSMPVRVLIRRWRVQRVLDWSVLTDPKTMFLGLFMLTAHPVGWPLTVLTAYFLGNQVGAL